MGPSLSPISKTQPQLSQLELIFKGPLVKDSQVDTTANLLTLGYNYNHKIVWVKSEKSNYLLTDGDGTDISHWEKISQKVSIKPYNSGESYTEYDMVYTPGAIYVAIQDVPENTHPSTNSDYWLSLSGEILTRRYIFEEQSSIIIYVDINNPLFEIVMGIPEKDGDDEYVIGDDGMINIIDPEIIEATIARRTDLANDNGRAYEITFIENSIPVELSGAINVK